MAKRVLFTGSRDWGEDSIAERAELKFALSKVFEPGAVLVSGVCPTGADYLAEQFWTACGGTVDPFPADWSQGRKAGPQRNQGMVDKGADVCLAFIRNNSRGATGCADMAEKAGIPTYRFTSYT